MRRYAGVVVVCGSLALPALLLPHPPAPRPRPDPAAEASAIPEFQARSFFGVLNVERRERIPRNPTFTLLIHGSTPHQAAEVFRGPLTYYDKPEGPTNPTFTLESPWKRADGVIGLGSGSLAAYSSGPGQGRTFYEIDEVVRQLAEHPNAMNPKSLWSYKP